MTARSERNGPRDLDHGAKRLPSEHGVIPERPADDDFRKRISVAGVDMAQTLIEFGRVTWQVLRGRDRLGKIRMIMQEWIYAHSDHPPSRFLIELFPDLRDQSVAVTVDITHEWELPYGERLILAALVRKFEPRSIFEFGTFTGATTKLFADLSAGRGVKIHTLDLPNDDAALRGIPNGEIGRCFMADRRYDEAITMHRANSRLFDYSPFKGSIDLVYIDGSHDYSDVLHDSRAALEMLSANGVIVWDDYGSVAPGVVNAIRDLRLPVVRLALTRLVFYHQSLL